MTTQKTTIQIVEDDGLVAEDIRRSLEESGFAVSRAVPTAVQALESAKEDSPDLVLMDIKLKGDMDGTEAALKIHDLYDIPIIYLTAYCDTDVLEKAKLCGPFGYIVKPFDDRELKTTIEIALYKHAMEKRLKDSEQWLLTTLNSIGDGVITTDTTGMITFINPVAESLTGWNISEALNQSLDNVFQIINESTGQPVGGLARKVIDEGRVLSLDNTTLLIRRNSTDKVLIGDSAAPIRNKKGEITGTVIVFRDITHKRRMEEHLLTSQKMQSVGTLAGGIAHEFNNILGGIMGYTELALEDIPADSPGRDSLEEISKLSDRARDVIKQLLMFSSKSWQERTVLQPHLPVASGLRVLRATTPASIEIRSDISENTGPIMGDPIQLQQVLVNLCLNAVQALEGASGGLIEVGLWPVVPDAALLEKCPELSVREYTQLTVTDNGTGIEPEILHQIFDPFFTTKDVGKGSGLGLAVVHGIVKNHGGTIHVSSTPGRGTTVTAFFPKARAEQTVADRKEEIPTGNEHILLVDDEGYLAVTTKRILEHLGYTVTALTDSRETFEIFKADPEQFDLVITDLSMPHMNGDRLASEIVGIRPDIPVILATGYADAVSDDTLQACGIKALLPKPSQKRDIAGVIRSVLDRH